MVAIIGGNVLGLERSSAKLLGANGQLGSASAGRLGSGVSVNAFTGNLVIQNQDEVLQGTGPDLALLRTYNSLGLLNDGNGDNWRESAQRKIEVVTAGSVLRLTDWDGSTSDFVWDANFVKASGGAGAYVNKDGGGAYDWISTVPNGYYFIDGDTLRRDIFDATKGGRITGTQDFNAAWMGYSYDANGQLSRVTTVNGEYTDLVWSGNQLTQVVTRNSSGGLLAARTYYSYDSAGRLSTVTTDLTPGDGSIADGKVATLTYAYDGTSRRITSISETGSGAFVSFTYVLVGSDYRIATVTETAADGSAATTSYSYDTANRRTTVTDALGKASVIAFDTAGNITSITAPPDGTGTAAQVVQFGYNANGDVTSYTDGLGRITSYSYDAHGNLTESVDPAGNRMRYEYDSRNQLLKKVLVVNTSRIDKLPITGFDEAYYLAAYGDILNAGDLVDPAQHYAQTGWHEGRNPNALFNTNQYLAANPDVAAAGINPLDHYLQAGWREGRLPATGVTTAEFIARYVNQTTRYAYDSLAHLRFAVSSEGRVTEYRYNSLGQKIATIDYTRDYYTNGWTLSSSDNITEAGMAAWVAGLGATSAVQRTDTSYDFRGNVASEVSYADLNVNRVQYSKFENGSTGWWAWQSQPNMLQGGLASGVEQGTGKAYMALAFKATSSSNYVAIVGDQAYSTTTPGERLAVRTGVSAQSGIGEVILRVQFMDVNGNWITEQNVGTVSGAQPFNTVISGFVTTPANAVRMRLVIYANAATLNTTLSFNITEPMISQAANDQTVVPAFVPGTAAGYYSYGAAETPNYSYTNYTYDQFGNLLARTTSGTVGSEVFSYDGLGRLLTATDLAGATTTTVYNDAARSVTVTQANGSTKTSVYSARGEVLSYTEAAAGVPSETETYKYDKLGRLRITADATGMRDFAFFDDAGRKVGQMDAKGQLTEYRYDAAGRLAATISYANAISGGAIAALYDASGQPSRATITGARPAPSNYDRWEWNVYDAADRVVQKIETVRGAWESQSAKVTTYTYDRAGHLDKAVESANVLSPAVVAQLMAQTPGTNLVKNAGFDGIGGWTTWNGNGILNSTVPYADVWQSQHYLKAEFTATAAGQAASLSGDTSGLFSVVPGQQLSVKAGVETRGPISNSQLVVWWYDANGQPMFNTGVQMLGGVLVYGAQIEGTVTVPTGAAKARLEYYVWTSGAGTGFVALIEPKVSLIIAPQATIAPTASSADRVTRNFWSKDGLLIGQLDGVGAFTQMSYDRAGRLTKTRRYANLVPWGYWSNGTYEQMLAAVGTSGRDRIDYVVYDGTGKVRYRLDGTLRPTEYVYDQAGHVIRTIEYAGSIEAGSTYSLSYVRSRITALGLQNNAATRITRSVYDGAGRLNFTIDAMGGVTSYAYDSATGLVVRTIRNSALYTAMDDPTAAAMWAWAAANWTGADKTSRSIYDGLGRLAYSVDAEGYIAEYQYDLDDRVIKEIRYPSSYAVYDGATVNSVAAQIGATAANDPQTVIKTFAYDAAGQLTDSWDGEGVRTHFDYDAFGQVWRTINAVGTSDESISAAIHDTSGKLVNRFNAYGTTEQTVEGFAYDGVGNLIWSVDANNNSSGYSYDAAGNRTSATLTLGANQLATSYFEYDAFGNAVKTTDPLGYVSYAYYDRLGRNYLSIDAEGYATGTVFDALGTVHSVTRYAVRPSGTPTTASEPAVAANAADATTTFAYDRLGRLTSTTDAMGFAESFTYDAFGNKLTSTNKLGGVTNYSYDRRGLIRSEWRDQNSYNEDTVLIATRSTTTYDYDARGNLKTKVEAADVAGNQLTTTFAYNRRNELISRIDPAFLGMTPVTQFQYDKRGNLVLQIAADGGKTFAWYDDNNRKIAELTPAGTDPSGTPIGAISHYSYDANGNLLWRKTFATTVAMPGGANGAIPSPGGDYRQTSFTYDARNMLKSTKTQAVTVGYVSAGNLVTEFKELIASNIYDADGRLVVETDARGGQIYHYYDKLGREVAKRDQEGYLTTWTRDAEGNVLSETRYANRVNAPAQVGGLTPPPVTADPANDRVTTFTYDKMGRRLSETRQGVAYGNVGGTGQLSLATGSATVVYTYNAAGEVTSKRESTLDKVEYQYDRQGRLERQLEAISQDFNATGTAQNRRVTYFYYDANNNLVRSVERVEDASAAAAGPGTIGAYAAGYSAADDHIMRYGYVANQLHWTLDDSNTQRFTWFDIMGRTTAQYVRRLKSDGSFDAINAIYEGNLTNYDQAGRITAQYSAAQNNQYNWIAQGPVTTLGYNAYGEVTTKAVGGQMVEASDYDAAGRVIKTNSGDGVWKFFVYDANGNATVTMTTSVGAANQSGLGRDAELSGLTGGNGNISIDALTQGNVTATLVAYDWRNMVVASYEPGRQIANSADVTQTVTARLTRTRGYTAFGEVSSETDARGNVTSYTYNTMGRLTRKESPWVTVVGEDGNSSSQRPTENYAYDASGRQIAVQDANGFWTTRLLRNGSGYGGAQPLVLKEFRPDSTVWEARYDAWGNTRLSIDGLGRQTSQSFDKLNRLIQQVRPSGFTDNYEYDVLGQRITHWNSYYGAGLVETTDYDIAGRVISTRNFAGDVTSTSYAFSTGIVTTGLGQFGGWTKTTQTPYGSTTSETTDLFGHQTARTDMGGRSYTYGYNSAGLIASLTSPSGQSVSYAYYNTGLASAMNDNSGTISGWATSNVDATYNYDAEGNRVWEKLAGTYTNYSYYGYTGTTTTLMQDGRGSYDAMGRLTQFTDYAAGGAVNAIITNSYDAAGNMRRVQSTHLTYTANQTQGANTSEDFWYKYDSLGRMTLAKGALINGTIALADASAVTPSTEGYLITYDAAGQRATQTRSIWVQSGYLGYSATSQEIYAYNADGNLTSVTLSSYNYGSGLRAVTAYDGLGRVSTYTEYAGDGSGQVQYSRYNIQYDARNAVTSEQSTLRRVESDGNLYVSYTNVTNSYGAGGLLNSTFSSNYRYKFGTQYQDTPDTQTTYTYQWWDGPQQATVTFTPNTSSPGTKYTSTYNYDLNGHLSSVSIADGRPRTVSYVTDVSGQILKRTEADGIAYNSTNGTGGDPIQQWWFFNGQQLGTTGNNGNDDPTFETALNERIQAPANSAVTPFRLGSQTATTWSDFDQAYNSLSPGEGGGAASSYTVHAGDTLDRIAQTVYGDASLWYRIADANGLSGTAALVAGQTLRLPANAQTSHNTSTTFRPYDAARAIGDVSPTTPKPPKKPACGGFGAIILMVIAVAVTAIATAGATAALSGQAFGSVLGSMFGGAAVSGVSMGSWIVGGAIGGAVGSVVSQGVGVATGLQDKFSWKSVAMAGISGAVGGAFQGLGNAARLAIDKAESLAGHALDAASQQAAVAGKIGKVGAFLTRGGFTSAAVRGVLSSTITQGIGVATGLQDKFSWAAVAGAGLGAGVAGVTNFGGFAGALISNGAGAIANAAVRSVIEGSDFGDNMLAALPDIIGGTIGNLAAGAVAGDREPSSVNTDNGKSGSSTTANDGPQGSGSAIGSSDGKFGDAIVVTARHSDAVYRPSGYGSLFLLAQNRQNPRARMGGNGGPPLEDYRVLRQLGQPVPNGPAGAIFGVLDNLFDITGPATSLQIDLLDASIRNDIADILEIDPGHRFPVRLGAAGSERQSLRWKLADFNFYKSDLAATRYRVQGDIGALQNETLRVYQQFVDAGFKQALAEANAGTLFQPQGWSRAQALGSRMDVVARQAMRSWLSEFKIVSDRNVSVNSRLAAQPEGNYTVPDVRVGGVVFDASIARKSVNTYQVQQFYTSPSVKSVFIVRPTSMGGSYFLPRPGNR